MRALRVAILIAGLAAALLPWPAAAGDGIRLRLEPPPDAVAPGTRAELGIELVDAAGNPQPAERDLEIVLATGDGLLETTKVTLPAGESSVRAPMRPERPGAWVVAAEGQGLFPATAPVLCADPSPRPLAQPLEDPDKDGAAPAPAGLVKLKPGHAEVTRGHDGLFRSRVHAVWFEGEEPVKRAEDLELTFIADRPDARIEPEKLTLAAGDILSSAEIESDAAGEVELTAYYEAGESQPAKIRFLPSRPAALGFVRDGFEMKSLAGADLDVVVRLHDRDGTLVVTEAPRPVSLSLETPGGVENYLLEIPAGGFEARTPLHVDRFGASTLKADAERLAPARATVVLRLEWVLLLVALAGGIVGSLTRALFARGEKGWKKGLWRSVALGAVAAILVLLLALFRVLSKLGEALPALTGLDEVPLSNPLGIFLIGLVAGLALESIFAWFTGRKSPPAEPDAPAEA